jgi:hypothetical protein
MTQEDAKQSTDAVGEIVAHGRDFLHVRVRLEDDREVVAVIPKSRIRKLGCWFGDFVGWRVRVGFPQPPRAPRIVEFLSRPLPGRTPEA